MYTPPEVCTHGGLLNQIKFEISYHIPRLPRSALVWWKAGAECVGEICDAMTCLRLGLDIPPTGWTCHRQWSR